VRGAARKGGPYRNRYLGGAFRDQVELAQRALSPRSWLFATVAVPAAPSRPVQVAVEPCGEAAAAVGVDAAVDRLCRDRLSCDAA
jgi:hypothetical protein